MHKIVFQSIPSQLEELKNDINNPIIKKLYSSYSFSYLPIDLNYQENIKKNFYEFLLNHLQKFKFIVYNFINSSKSSSTSLNQENPLLKPTEQSTTNIIICVEKQCIIIEQIEIAMINQILGELKSSQLNVTSDIEEDKISNEEKYAKDEIESFCSKFSRLINSNPFVQLTINSIVGYSIRRFFYPSNFFNDPSFFQFDKHQNYQSQLFDIKISKKLTEILESSNESETKTIIQNLKKTINETCEIDNQSQICEFTEKDFIFLRPIHVNESFSFNLVIHIETFYIFLVKKMIYFNDMSKINHEIDFCQNYRHRSFTRFYGFLKNDEKITGFVYEFMSNGNLLKYFHNHSNETDKVFSILTMIRIFEGIEYLHSNSLIHRDLKPLNILLDHNNLPFIADFETIRKIRGENETKDNFTFDFVSILYSSPEQYNNEVISYSTDIYSFGLIVYFLFEKKDMLQILNETFIYEAIKNKNIPKISNVSMSIQKLYELNVNYDKEKRLSLQENKNLIIEDLYSTSYLDDYLINNYQLSTISTKIIQFFIEIIHFDGKNSELFDGILNNFIKLYSILKNDNRLNILLNNGNLSCLEGNYFRARKFYEIGAKMNNIASINNLLVLYKAGIDFNKNLLKLKKYTEIIMKQNNASALFNLGHFYFSFKNDNNSQAIDYYKVAAKLNDPYSQFFLGYLYFEGRFVEQNTMKAMSYFEKSKNEVPISLFLLGYIYLSGQDVEEDYLKAIEYFDLYEVTRYKKEINSYIIKEGYIIINQFNTKKFFKSIIKILDLDYFLYLGVRYQIGEGVIRNYYKAKYYYEIVAETKNSYAFLFLGNLYISGFGCQKNYKKAREYYELSAIENNYESYNNLGMIYQYGLDVEINYSKAKYFYEISAKHGDSGGCVNLGVLYFNGQGVTKDYKKAKEYFELSANLENEAGLFYLGLLYHFGFGVKQDYFKAKHYYELSAAKKYLHAFVNLGNLYAFGLLGKYDYEKAKECYEIAAKYNDQTALINLGVIYAKGYGVPVDHLRAKYYFEMVAFQKNPQFNSIFKTEDCYDSNKKYDYLKSLSGFGFSVIRNNSLAYLQLADLYLSSKYIKRDYKKAIEYLECSAKLEDSNAYLMLGNIYYLGKGVNKDYYKAFKYYEKSSHLGNQIAMDILGTFYMNGIYVKPNFVKAKYYFELSVSFKNLNSFYNLGCLYLSGELCDIDINKAIQYFKKCIESKIIIALITNFNFNIQTYEYINNDNYYPSYNKLGLIYLLHFNDINSANNYIKEAAFAEFPFAQNNYGLLLQFFLNNRINAERMYKRSSEHNFSLAEFNLGNLYEENGNIEKAIHYYILASEHEFVPLEFHGKNFDHNSLMISKIFIICLTNLKLVKYFYSKETKNSNYIETKLYFRKAISRLIIHDKYPFIFKYIKTDFSYLKSFVLNFPLFGFSNKIEEENQLYVKNRLQLTNKLKDKSIENKKKFSIFYDEDDISDEFVFEDPDSLFDFIFTDAIEMIHFMRIIEDIIEIMKSILYSPPFSILFGCANTFQRNLNEKNKSKNIDHIFYEGFEI